MKARKREGESFSETVKRLAGERPWNEITGILSEDEAADLEAAIEEGRTKFGERSDRFTAELDESRRRRDIEMIQDTSFIIDLLRGDENAERLLDIVEKEARPQKVSSVTVLELYEGVARSQISDTKRE
ncbi:antitoxin VapB family protein [Haloterrigena salinisoli]|uniref:antitoxin VapB family protein n=1 Tax=Haloterrigena salinisoli TaxID=3132747 RepID=UPI00387E9F72